MELTPGERLILRQLGDLYSSTSRREHPLGKVTSQWPAVHVDAYRGVLGSLISKNLIEITDQGRAVRVTDAGMRAMGVADAPETKTSAKAPTVSPVALKTRRLGLVGQLVFIALAAAAIVVLWLVLWPR